MLCSSNFTLRIGDLLLALFARDGSEDVTLTKKFVNPEVGFGLQVLVLM